MYGNANMYNLLISCISYEAGYKEYYLSSKTRPGEQKRLSHPAYLATLLHSNNAKDVKELQAYIRKKWCEGFYCANFIIALKENVFIFNATLSRGWCISSSVLRTFR